MLSQIILYIFVILETHGLTIKIIKRTTALYFARHYQMNERSIFTAQRSDFNLLTGLPAISRLGPGFVGPPVGGTSERKSTMLLLATI